MANELSGPLDNLGLHLLVLVDAPFLETVHFLQQQRALVILVDGRRRVPDAQLSRDVYKANQCDT